MGDGAMCHYCRRYNCICEDSPKGVNWKPLASPIEETAAKRTLGDVLEELCPGVRKRNWPAWAWPYRETDDPKAIEPMMTDRDEYAVEETAAKHEVVEPEIWLSQTANILNLYLHGYQPKDVALELMAKIAANWPNMLDDITTSPAPQETLPPLDPVTAEMVRKAWEIAVSVHGLQLDMQGESYLFHVARVAMAMETHEEQVCALLHDVLEDSQFTDTWALTIQAEFQPEVLRCCIALCHLDGESYEAYIRRVSENPLAIKVKLADLADNMNPERLFKLPEKTYLRLLAKYSAAVRYLRNPLIAR